MPASLVHVASLILAKGRSAALACHEGQVPGISIEGVASQSAVFRVGQRDTFSVNRSFEVGREADCFRSDCC